MKTLVASAEPPPRQEYKRLAEALGKLQVKVVATIRELPKPR